MSEGVGVAVGLGDVGVGVGRGECVGRDDGDPFGWDVDGEVLGAGVDGDPAGGRSEPPEETTWGAVE